MYTRVIGYLPTGGKKEYHWLNGEVTVTDEDGLTRYERKMSLEEFNSIDWEGRFPKNTYIAYD